MTPMRSDMDGHLDGVHYLIEFEYGTDIGDAPEEEEFVWHEIRKVEPHPSARHRTLLEGIVQSRAEDLLEG